MIYQKFDVKWKYVLCFIFADTAFLLGAAELLNLPESAANKVGTWINNAAKIANKSITVWTSCLVMTLQCASQPVVGQVSILLILSTLCQCPQIEYPQQKVHAIECPLCPKLDFHCVHSSMNTVHSLKMRTSPLHTEMTGDSQLYYCILCNSLNNAVRGSTTLNRNA